LVIGRGRQKNLQSTTTLIAGGSVSASYTRGIINYLVQRQLEVPDFLAEFGLDTQSPEDANKRVPLTVYEAMLERAGELAGDDNAGLHVGECIRPGQYGALGLSVMSCKTAGEAFERHMRYENLVSDRAVSTYHFEGEQIRLSWDTHGLSVGRKVAEENVASWVTFLRWITGQSPELTAINFSHNQPSDLSEYERIFSCAIAFNQPMVELIFPAQHSELPLTQHDPVMREMMDAYAENLLQELSQGDGLLGDVRGLMVEAMATGTVSLDIVADQLAITPRTLQRRLNDRGETFKNILDEVRKGLALSYIAQPFIDLAELAYLLGFADQTAFQRAFKKWTGTSPGKYKKLKLTI
jgi:AraC-like DNA-binding protein